MPRIFKFDHGRGLLQDVSWAACPCLVDDAGVRDCDWRSKAKNTVCMGQRKRAETWTYLHVVVGGGSKAKGENVTSPGSVSNVLIYYTLLSILSVADLLFLIFTRGSNRVSTRQRFTRTSLEETFVLCENDTRRDFCTIKV